MASESTPSRTLPFSIETTCNRDCPDACGIVATVDANAEGDLEIVRLQGNKAHPVTAGFLCYRTSHFLEQQNADRRLRTPHIRRGGVLVPTSWDVALDAIAKQMQRVITEDSAEAIFHYRSGGNLGALLGVTDLFWQMLGPVTTKSGDICTGAPDAAQDADFGGRESNDVADLENARNIIIWGRNVFTCSPHTVPVLKRARGGANHTKITCVDPTFHRTAAFSDVAIQPRPGNDFALAMAVGRLLVDTDRVHPDASTWCEDLEGYIALCRSQTAEHWRALADVSAHEVAHLADALSDGPTTVLIGWGMGRRRHGGATTRAVDALCAVTGNIGIAGAGASYYFNRKTSVRKVAVVAKEEFGFTFKPSPNEISEPLLADELDPARTRLMWVTAGNPVAMLPGSARIKQAFEAIEMVVVVDTWWSDSAKCADVVLPCATLLERDDVVPAYGHHYIGRARAVLPPQGDAKTDRAILQALAPKLGLEKKLSAVGFFDDDEQWMQRLAAPLSDAGVSLAELDQGAQRSPLSPKIAWEGRRFSTPTGRAHLVTTAPGLERDLQPRGRTDFAPNAFPLRLHSLSHPKSQSSQWVESGLPIGPAECRVHPAASAGVRDGAVARLRSAHGEMEVRVVFDATQRRDTALVPKGGSLDQGRCANVLIAPGLTDVGEGAALYDEWVTLEPLPNH